MTWAELQKRMEAETTITMSKLDLIVDEAFNVVQLASTDPKLCVEVHVFVFTFVRLVSAACNAVFFCGETVRAASIKGMILPLTS